MQTKKRCVEGGGGLFIEMVDFKKNKQFTTFEHALQRVTPFDISSSC